MEKNYEAWDINYGVCIYNGPHQNALVTIVKHYINVAKHINESYIHTKDIEALNDTALKYIGIEIYRQTKESK